MLNPSALSQVKDDLNSMTTAMRIAAKPGNTRIQKRNIYPLLNDGKLMEALYYFFFMGNTIGKIYMNRYYFVNKQKAEGVEFTKSMRESTSRYAMAAAILLLEGVTSTTFRGNFGEEGKMPFPTTGIDERSTLNVLLPRTITIVASIMYRYPNSTEALVLKPMMNFLMTIAKEIFASKLYFTNDNIPGYNLENILIWMEQWKKYQPNPVVTATTGRANIPDEYKRILKTFAWNADAIAKVPVTVKAGSLAFSKESLYYIPVVVDLEAGDSMPVKDEWYLG